LWPGCLPCDFTPFIFLNFCPYSSGRIAFSCKTRPSCRQQLRLSPFLRFRVFPPIFPFPFIELSFFAHRGGCRYCNWCSFILLDRVRSEFSPSLSGTGGAMLSPGPSVCDGLFQASFLFAFSATTPPFVCFHLFQKTSSVVLFPPSSAISIVLRTDSFFLPYERRTDRLFACL